jgi:lauroyl/myristoyl acyltransferase
MAMSMSARAQLALRPRIPVAVMPRMVRARTRRALADPAAVAEARRQMDFVVGADRPDADLDALVEKYVAMQKWRAEARWHPELLFAQDVEDVDLLLDANQGGRRGVLVNFCHHGLWEGFFGALARAGADVAPIVVPAMLADSGPAWLMQQARIAFMHTPPLSSDLGVRGFLRELEGGAMLGIATDVPSTTPMTFLGRQVRGAYGTARMSHSSGTPVAVVSARRAPDNGPHPNATLRVVEVIDPAEHETPRSVLDAILGHLETAVRAWPEAYDEPLKRWTYDPAEQTADA